MGSSSLSAAASAGHTAVVAALLAAAADANNVLGGVPPLVLAAQNGLSCAGCSGEMRCSYLRNGVIGHESVVRLLLEGGSNANAKLPCSGWTALMLAAQNGLFNIVQLLVSHHCDVNQTNVLETTALDIASAYYKRQPF